MRSWMTEIVIPTILLYIALMLVAFPDLTLAVIAMWME